MKNEKTAPLESGSSLNRATLGAALAFLSAGVAGDVNAAVNDAPSSPTPMVQTYVSPAMQYISNETDAATLAAYCKANVGSMKPDEQNAARLKYQSLMLTELEKMCAGKTKAEIGKLKSLPANAWIKSEPYATKVAALEEKAGAVATTAPTTPTQSTKLPTSAPLTLGSHGNEPKPVHFASGLTRSPVKVRFKSDVTEAGKDIVLSASANDYNYVEGKVDAKGGPKVAKLNVNAPKGSKITVKITPMDKKGNPVGEEIQITDGLRYDFPPETKTQYVSIKLDAGMETTKNGKATAVVSLSCEVVDEKNVVATSTK